jgi:hypothetical protein
MAQANLLDIAKLNGSDAVVGLIEENMSVAPELSVFPARTIRGTSYKIAVRDSYPGVGFRNANEGTTYTKSTFSNKTIEAYILAANVRADVAVANAYEDGPDAWKAIEASGVMRQAMIEIGSQIFYGTSVDSKGFPGLEAIHTAYASGLVVDAGGTTAGTGSSVYGVKFGPQDVQLIFGNGTAFELGDWFQQMVNDGTAGQDYLAYVAALTSWVGLQVGSKYSVSRLKDATADSTKGVTDAKLAELLSLHPVGHRPDYWFMNRRSAYQLQSSRSSTVNGTGSKSATGAEVWAPLPTESNGIPIIVTDSIGSTETLS